MLTTYRALNKEIKAKDKRPMSLLEWITIIMPIISLFKRDPRKKALRMLKKLRKALERGEIDREEYDRLRDEILENV